MTYKFTCINCPKSCRLLVHTENKEVQSVQGNSCKRGYDFAVQEIICPMRILTGTMKANGCNKPFSVRSSSPIPKSLLIPAATILRTYHPALPIHIGDVIISNILGTNTQIIATQNLDAK